MQKATGVFDLTFGEGGDLRLAIAPGRVNLIGDHTDYNGLPVFPMAIERRIEILFRPRPDGWVRMASANGFDYREFEVGEDIKPYPAGDWGNYAKAAAQALSRRYGMLRGFEGVVDGDIPPAAGLSSSSALMVAAALALLDSNAIPLSFEELMEVLPEGEHYVGTRGGGMDHAACLGGEEGKALKIDFTPFRMHPTPVPNGWCFLVGHSLVRAEKSREVKEQYNARRKASQAALKRFGAGATYPKLLRRYTAAELVRREKSPQFRHVVTEAGRVEAARKAMIEGDMDRFGALMQESHASLRDDFEVSHVEVDALVDTFMAAGAAGARVTGAGFGGCAVAVCWSVDKEEIMRRLETGFYAVRPQRSGFGEYLMEAIPSEGARVVDLTT